jgi:CSLREA domain-containing protein
LAAVPADENIRVRRDRGAFGVLAALVCALIALTVVPALASAETFTVDSTGDAPKTATGAVCETETGECTLRAAIEAANTTNLFDEILFDPGVFDGAAPASTITLGSPLPAMIHSVEIDARQCPTSYGVDGPCAEVVGLPASSSAPNVFTVSGDDVTIRDLAIEGGLNGVLDAEHGGAFTAVGDWFGVELNGGRNGGSFESGVLVEENNAIIGGDTRGDYEEDRNVFGLSQIGVDVQGSSHASIQGNYIGVGPNGGGPASLAVGVRIVDAEGSPSKAADDEVGGVLTAGQAASLECDGPCNVIATEGGIDIDLTGEAGEPASGPTTIRGNYLGLAADGLSPVGENSTGVDASPGQSSCGGGPGDVTVGGAAPTESNYIDAGSFGIFAEGAENFRALGNSIGFLADGRPGESPIAFGIEVCAEGVTEPAQISNNNLLLGPSAFGIVSEWGRAEISGNTIRGGQIGVLTGADSEGHGDRIQGNIVTAPELDGIQIQSQSNTVIGNTISGAGQAGIDLEEADLNRVGGDLAGEENDIEGSGVGAIFISGSAATRDEVRGNTGFGNAGPFIQLLEGEPGERPNAAVEPPTFATALQSSATGTAKPDSTVRIFSKASAEPGELASLLAVVHADPTTGVWSATYATVPVGTLVAATETSTEGATSEVSEPSVATADPIKPIEPEEHEAGGGGGAPSAGSSSPSGSSSSSPPILAQPPKVKISKRPAKSSKSTAAKFKFTATPAADAKFQCKLDNAKWANCKSPKTYKHLKPRKHTFQVRATVSGVTGPAAKVKFTVKR